MLIKLYNKVDLVMWLASGSSCSTPLYPVLMHTGSELYVRSTGLSSSQQRLVICVSEINTVVMCGSLFILSCNNVSSKLNQFCHSVDTSLGLSHCVVHIRAAGSLNPASVGYFWIRLPVWHSSLFSLSGQCFHRRCLTRRTLPLAGWDWWVRGQVKWNWQRVRSAERED